VQNALFHCFILLIVGFSVLYADWNDVNREISTASGYKIEKIDKMNRIDDFREMYAGIRLLYQVTQNV